MELKDINDATTFIKKVAASKPWFNISKFVVNCPLGQRAFTTFFFHYCKRYFADETSASRFLITIENRKINLSHREFILLYLSSYQELKIHQVSSVLQQSEDNIIAQLVAAKSKIAS